MVFKQDRFTVDLGSISNHIQEGSLEHLKKSKDPLMLFLPATYEDATNFPVMDNIISVIKNLQEKNENCIDSVVLGLDTADELDQFLKVKERFNQIPNSIVIWNNSPEMKVFYDKLKDEHIPVEPGKGRNMWTGLGYRFIDKRGSSFALHDCDIKPEFYNQNMLLSLIAPIVNPKLDFDFSKAYYTRITGDDKKRLSGRVTRLLVAPLLDALKKNYGYNKANRHYLNFMSSFRYALSGEVAMKAKIANLLPVHPDWGLEIGTLGFLTHQPYRIAQVNLGLYDHKHSPESPDNPNKGLHKMSIEIVKAVFRKLYSNAGNKVLDPYTFSIMQQDFKRYSREYVKSYELLSINNCWDYNFTKEIARTEQFMKSIDTAFAHFVRFPEEIRTLPNWDEIDRDNRKELRKIVNKYNSNP